MKTALIAIFGMMSLPALSAEISFRVQYKNYDCVYDAEHLYQSGSEEKLAMSTSATGNAANIETHVLLQDHNPTACPRYNFLEVVVNENWLTSNDVKYANRLVATLSHSGHQQIMIKGKTLVDGPADVVDNVIANADGTAKVTKVQNVDRAAVQLKDLPNYQNFLNVIQDKN